MDCFAAVDRGMGVTKHLTKWTAHAQSLIEPQDDQNAIREGQEGWGWEITYDDEDEQSEASTASMAPS